MSDYLSPERAHELLLASAPLSPDVQNLMDLVTAYRAVNSQSPAPEQDAYRAVLLAVLRLKCGEWVPGGDVEGEAEGLASGLYEACSGSDHPWSYLPDAVQNRWRKGSAGFTWRRLNFCTPGARPPSAASTIEAAVSAEVSRATVKFPTWPTDPLHALAVLGEEFGELTKAMLQLTYEPHKTTQDEVRSEAIQTAAMALRLAMSLDRYQYARSEQHSQGGSLA